MHIFYAKAKKQKPENNGTAKSSDSLRANCTKGIDIKILATLRATPNSESQGMSNIMHSNEFTRVANPITHTIENNTLRNSDPAKTNANPMKIIDRPTTIASL